MRRRNRKIVEGRGLPQAWRSSFAKYGPPQLREDEEGNVSPYAQFLAFHSVAAGKVSLVRRIEVAPTLAKRGESPIYRWPDLPEQGDELQTPGLDPALMWHWRWVLAHREADNLFDNTDPGAILQFAIGQDPWTILNGLATLHDFHGSPQRMHGGYMQACAHGTGTRFVIEGPRVMALVALVSGGALNLGGEQEKLPFGNSYGSLEGIDLDTDEFMRSPVRWLVP